MPFTWGGTPPPAGRIKTGTVTAFLSELGSIPAASSKDLAIRRKAHRDKLVSTTTADKARTALDRVLVFERVGQAKLEIACDRQLMSKFRIPRDRISDVVNRLRGDIKQAKRDKADAVPQMRATLAESAPASLRPQCYVPRGIENEPYTDSFSEELLVAVRAASLRQVGSRTLGRSRIPAARL
jgi:hypothetical protein